MHTAPEKIIDFHTHILPAFDDGPADCRTAGCGWVEGSIGPLSGEIIKLR